MIAYKTRQKVLSGGHGFGCKLFEPLYPVLLLPFSEIYKKYNVSFLLTYNDYLPKKIMEEIPSEKMIKFGKYELYRVR
jgi:hypothetical protein